MVLERTLTCQVGADVKLGSRGEGRVGSRQKERERSREKERERELRVESKV